MEEVGSLRWRAADRGGIPIFRIGAVIAYMGADLLGALRFSVFMVDRVGFPLCLRELAVVINSYF